MDRLRRLNIACYLRCRELSRRIPEPRRGHVDGAGFREASFPERGPALEPLAEPLFSLLLGERHRRRLLGIDPQPTPAQAAAHADAALALLGLAR